MTLEHLALNVPDPAAAAAWYAENLGLRVAKVIPGAPFIHFLADDGGSLIELYNNPAGAVPDYPAMNPYTLHLAFTVGDIAAEHQRLLAAGAGSAGAIAPTPTGDLLVFLRDPWGVPLQLVQRNAPVL